MPEGLILIDKPSGWTSFDVVAKIRGVLRQAQSQKLKAESHTDELSALDFQPSATLRKVKVGHTGTLDPLATGLLVLTVGTYCKRAAEFSKLDKTYEVTMKLGYTSTTGDAEGKITKSVRSDTKCDKNDIEKALAEFKGEIKQTPPAYSAIKVNGQRAYKLAREGKEVVLEPRLVRIDRLELVEYAYPEVKFITDVSSGTYIRSLVQDIGDKLEVGAYMTALRRTRVGAFKLQDAIRIEDFNVKDADQVLITLPNVAS